MSLVGASSASMAAIDSSYSSSTSSTSSDDEDSAPPCATHTALAGLRRRNHLTLLTRPLLLSGSLAARRTPLVSQRASLTMSAPDLTEWTKVFWAEVATAGQSKDAAKVVGARPPLVFCHVTAQSRPCLRASWDPHLK